MKSWTVAKRNRDRIMQAVLGDSIYMVEGVDLTPPGDCFRRFEPKGMIYHWFCDDFGPMSLVLNDVFV